MSKQQKLNVQQPPTPIEPGLFIDASLSASLGLSDLDLEALFKPEPPKTTNLNFAAFTPSITPPQTERFEPKQMPSHHPRPSLTIQTDLNIREPKNESPISANPIFQSMLSSQLTDILSAHPLDMFSTPNPNLLSLNVFSPTDDHLSVLNDLSLFSPVNITPPAPPPTRVVPSNDARQFLQMHSAPIMDSSVFSFNFPFPTAPVGKAPRSSTDKDKEFPCPHCDKVFDKSQNLKSHLRRHSGTFSYHPKTLTTRHETV
jgi:uncharacterized C2H2 Zn-finger protein